MQFNRLPAHIRQQWETAKPTSGERRIVQTLLPLTGGNHEEIGGLLHEEISFEEFMLQATERATRNEDGFFLAHEFVAKVFSGQELRSRMLCRIAEYLKKGEIAYGDPPLKLTKSEIENGAYRYRSLSDEFRESDLTEFFKTRNEWPDASDKEAEPTEPERRLARLRQLGGSAKSKNGKWRFSGISELVELEKFEVRKRCDEKTIRSDLTEALKAEEDEKRAGKALRLTAGS